jgi:hypothetical protein
MDFALQHLFVFQFVFQSFGPPEIIYALNTYHDFNYKIYKILLIVARIISILTLNKI